MIQWDQQIHHLLSNLLVWMGNSMEYHQFIASFDEDRPVTFLHGWWSRKWREIQAELDVIHQLTMQIIDYEVSHSDLWKP